MQPAEQLLLSGNQAVALAALHSGVSLGTGYPGTPSTEILETFSALGGKAQWAPNEKVAAEVALGVAFAGARALATMKHVGLNVAADVLFTMAYAGVTGGYVLVSADDPGMASSQNEQDSRRYAEAAGVPMFEPADSQEAYDYIRLAFQISERWHTPVLFRMTTRVCHTKSLVTPGTPDDPRPALPFERNISEHVMVPGHARPAHKRLRQKLSEIAAWNEAEGPWHVVQGSNQLGIISAGISYCHARESAPDASFLKLGMTYPLPMQAILDFVASVESCMVIEENDPWLTEAIRAAGGNVGAKYDPVYRFGELNVSRVRRILSGDTTPEKAAQPGKPPQLCPGCPHRSSFAVLKELDCIVAGDIGCYTLAALPPLSAMDTMIDMGAAIGVGLGLRHALPPEDARRVVSVIGDSTFVHSGITGLVEMVYNPPATGHVVVILDNSTTAMTGLQEHPGTGRKLDLSSTSQLSYEELAKAIGIQNVHVVSPVRQREQFASVLREAFAKDELTLIIAKQPCLLAAKKRAKEAKHEATPATIPHAPALEPHAPATTMPVTNVKFAGLGGMGVVTASDILADVVFRAGLNVKKAEVHGMSQRGGSVSSDVRFGTSVFSPMIPEGESHYLVILAEDQVPVHVGQLAPKGTLITPQSVDLAALPDHKALNVAVLGVLSKHLPFSLDLWLEALKHRFPAKLHQSNEAAFLIGRNGSSPTTGNQS